MYNAAPWAARRWSRSSRRCSPPRRRSSALTVADRRGMLEFLHGKRGDVEVPSINGVSVEQARDLLRARDLLLTLQAERPDPAIPAGKIAGQVPLAGSRTPRGAAIQAFVSTGAERGRDPDAGRRAPRRRGRAAAQPEARRPATAARSRARRSPPAW